MPFMTRIPSDLARFGLTVELAAGWATRGSSSFAPAGVTCHWTAGPKDAADKSRPSLGVVTNGRPGLDGPLCNIYLARDGTCVVVAAGRANHAGAGGFRSLVGNSAVYGIEAECAGDNDWSKAQRKVYPVLVAALLSGLGRDASWGHGHHEWAPTRKIDIRDIMPTVRAEAAAILRNPTAPAPTPGDDMPLNDDDLRRLHDAVWFGYPGARTIPNEFAGNSEWAYTTLGSMTARINRDVVAPAVRELKADVATPAQPVQVDAAAVASALAGNQQFLAAIAKVVADENARRQAS